MRQVHFVVQVELDDADNPVSLEVADGGPWAYSDKPQVWNPESEEWREATEEEGDAACGVLSTLDIRLPIPSPGRIEERRIYVVGEDGAPEFYFDGDPGDFQIGPEQAAEEYHADNPEVPMVEVTLREVVRQPYIFDADESEEG